jgi:hypothetical protein
MFGDEPTPSGDYYGATFRYDKTGGAYPIYLNDPQIDEEDPTVELIYDLEEAEILLATLTDAVEQMREAELSYVQVSFGGMNSTGGRYTYSDPSGTLKVGDLVEVRTGSNEPRQVRVVGLGRGSWGGPVKPVIAKLERVTL